MQQSETWIETRLTLSNGPIRNLVRNEAKVTLGLDVTSCKCHSRRQFPVNLSRVDQSQPFWWKLTNNRLSSGKIDVIEHIERHHMAHSQPRDKSYFVSNDKGFIYNQLVQETMKRPDKSMPHRKLHKRGVRQKTFSDIVGVHGLSKDACYTVTVIYDTTNHKLITAFPTI